MRSTDSLHLVRTGLAGLIEADPVKWGDAEVRAAVPALLTALHQVGAVLAGVLSTFDARGLARADACRTTRSWLVAFGRMSGASATGWMSRAELLRELPALRAGALAGVVSAEHLRKVADLVQRLDLATVASFDAILAELAKTAGPAQVQRAGERIVAHADPDGAHPDPKAAFDRRGLTVSRSGSMVALRGQLDPEAGAALMTALNACTPPPGHGDERTAAQRRADALTDLVKRSLDHGDLPWVQSTRPQLGLLLTPDVLLSHAPAPAPPTVGGADADDDDGGPGRPRWLHQVSRPDRDDGPEAPLDALAETGVPPLPESAWLEWYGDIASPIAQRLSCDCDVWRTVLDPTTNLPLEVGRTRRLVPHWIRRALHARDRGCRWPGCEAAVAWTDAHHLSAWYHGGETNIDNLISLCRYHHVTVHEGQWRIRLDPETGRAHAYRPDGRPYELNPSEPHPDIDHSRAA